MAFIQMDFESQYLGCRNPISILLPDIPRPADPRKFYSENKRFKVLWLLHGTFGDNLDWLRRSKIEVYACEKNLAVVMPSGLNADYVNWKRFGIGYNMYDYLFEELMPMIYNWFPISDLREDNYIAGLSMGGYGTMVYALNHPEKFAVDASLSAPLQDGRNPEPIRSYPPNLATPPHLTAYRPDRRENQILNAGGLENYLRSPANTWDKLIENYKNGVRMPELYFCCGTKDFLYPAFQKFRKFTQEQGYTDIVFEEEEGYAHEWRFWDMYIEKILNRYLPLEKQEGLSF